MKKKPVFPKDIIIPFEKINHPLAFGLQIDKSGSLKKLMNVEGFQTPDMAAYWGWERKGKFIMVHINVLTVMSTNSFSGISRCRDGDEWDLPYGIMLALGRAAKEAYRVIQFLDGTGNNV